MGVVLNQNVDYSALKALASGADPKQVFGNDGGQGQAQQKYPKVILIAAISKDGFLSAGPNDKLKWVPREDQLWYREKTIQIKHLIIGRKTFELLPSRAKEYRTFWVYTKNLSNLFHNVNGANVSSAQTVVDAQAQEILSTTINGKAYKIIKPIQPLTNKKGEPIIGNKTFYLNLPPKELLAYMYSQGITQVAVVGGATIYDMFLKQKLVNEVYLTVVNIEIGQGVKSERLWNIFRDKKVHKVLNKRNNWQRIKIII